MVGHVVWTTRVTKMYHFVDERVDFSLYQQINIIALKYMAECNLPANPPCTIFVKEA